MYLFGTSSWKPWILAGGVDITRSVIETTYCKLDIFIGHKF